MDKDTVKLIRVPADTWRAVVEALSGSWAAIMHGDTAEALETLDAALELARKVSAE